MDIKKEREAFEQHYHQTHSPIICRPYPVLENGDYKYIEIDQAWKLWQAAKAQVPEGFVLVPKEPTLMMSVAYEVNSIAPISSLSVRGYKAMLEAAQGEGHE